VMREDVEVFADHYVVHEREDGLIRLRVTDARTDAHHHVQFPEPTYDLDADANAEFEIDAYRLRYQSLITPASVFDYDIAEQRLRLLKQAEGRMMAKRNTFTDFIAAADHLVKDGYTAVDRLVIEGGSAGGLLMGAVLNLRPDCAAAAVLRVPFVDVINTMLDESLPLTVGEFEEWGNPKIREQYEYMKTYCPYTNLDARRYPAVLVKTSLHDSQVMYWEPA